MNHPNGFRWCLLLLACLLCTRPAVAHWADLAAADIAARDGHIRISLTVPTGLLAAADDNRDGHIDADELGRHQTLVRSVFETQITLTDERGTHATLRTVAIDNNGVASRAVPTGTHSTFLLIYGFSLPPSAVRMRYDLFLPHVSTMRCVATVDFPPLFSTVVFTPEQRELALGSPAPLAQKEDPAWSKTLLAPGLQALTFAFVLGALHAFSPGHGKTVVGAYLVGSKGTVPQAVLLGLVVTFTHTISVILLGVLCLYAFQYAVPDKLYPWMGFASGLLIATMGVYLLRSQTRRSQTIMHHPHDHSHDDHDHHHHHDEHNHHAHHPDHHHSHEHEHTHDAIGHTHGGSYHTHQLPQRITLYSLIALGVAGGIVPCPDALVVLLSAIALKKIALGILILIAFSLGIAAVLVAIGISMVCAGQLLDKYYPKKSLLHGVATFSYAAIIVLGLTIALQSLTASGILTIHLNV